MSEIDRYCDLVEVLAELEHEQWSHWINYQLKECAVDLETMTEEECEEARDKWEHWVDLAQAPYAKLSEKEKESDRVWARRVLATISATHMLILKEQLEK